MSRKKFYADLGASHATDFSWSAVNHAKQEVYFGAWEHHDRSEEGGLLVFSTEWERRHPNAHRNPNYGESLRNITLIQQGRYQLFTFLQTAILGGERIRLGNFSREVKKGFLVLKNRGSFTDFYAVELRTEDFKVDEVPVSDLHSEGTRYEVLQVGYERSAEARQQCLEAYGCACMICGIDFEKAYPGIGNGYIHVHHLVRMADREKPYKINGKEELRPVCPNCHAMVHKKVPPHSIEEVREIINRGNLKNP